MQSLAKLHTKKLSSLFLNIFFQMTLGGYHTINSNRKSTPFTYHIQHHSYPRNMSLIQITSHSSILIERTYSLRFVPSLRCAHFRNSFWGVQKGQQYSSTFLFNIKQQIWWRNQCFSFALMLGGLNLIHNIMEFILTHCICLFLREQSCVCIETYF